MKDREDRGADHSEDRHGFSCPIDRGAPGLFQQAQNGRDQSACVANSDPEDKIDDGPAPVDRIGETPDPDAGGNLVGEPYDGKHRNTAGDAECDPPTTRGLIFDNAADLMRNPMEIASVLD